MFSEDETAFEVMIRWRYDETRNNIIEMQEK
jgi:hypothetical protein